VPGWARRLALTVAVAAMLFAGWAGASIGGANTARASASLAARVERVPRFGHVFLIIGENTSASQITRKTASYLTDSIEPRAAWLTRYYAVAERSLGNYVAIMSGQFQQL
jgi:hypothetical protein